MSDFRHDPFCYFNPQCHISKKVHLFSSKSDFEKGKYQRGAVYYRVMSCNSDLGSIFAQQLLMNQRTDFRLDVVFRSAKYWLQKNMQCKCAITHLFSERKKKKSVTT